MSQHNDELLEHSYDGIKEEDNPMPMWWKWLFVITVIWAAGYMYYYHVSDWGDSSAQEYAAEFEQMQGNRQNLGVSNENFAELTDAASLKNGFDIFIKNCASCHGGTGGTGPGAGGIGPNLADEHWLHGGSMNDIVRVIMNGVPEKGMISWKSILRPKEVVEVASYIRSIKGSNPAGAKAPQGDVFKE